MALKDVGARFVVQGEQQFVNSMARGDAAMGNVGASAARMGNAARAGLAVVSAGVTGLIGGLLYAENAARAFESSFAGVRKTVDGTEAELQTIKQAFIDMSLAIPVSANELNRIGEAAGQLGVAKENIVEFTRVAAEMGIATNLSSDEAATSMARLANIVQLPQEQFRNLGSAVVDLGNHSAATESDILNMSLRLAGAGKIIGLTTPQILGMATALSSVGIEAESGGTAFSRVFVEMANNVKSGGETLELFAAVSGQTTAAFKKQFETDASGAIIAFVRGLDNINKTGGNVFETLKALELGEIRVRDALLRSAGAGDILEDSVKRGSQAWSDNSALTNEANERYKTTESQLIRTQNAIDEAARSLGERLQPAELEATKALLGFLNEALIPLVDTWGPRLGSFLSESVRGWTTYAAVLNNDTIPAMYKYAGSIEAVLGSLAKLPGFMGSAGQIGAGIWESFSGDTGSVQQSGFKVLQDIQKLRETQADARLEAERLGEELENLGVVSVGMGEKVEYAGAAIASTGAAAAVANPNVERLTKSLLGDGAASKAVATAKQEEAEARRLAAEAMRLEEARLEALRLARVKIVNEIAADSASNQAGVALRSAKNPRMGDLNLGIEALDKATAVSGDASVALALINKSIGEFSGVLSTLSGDDLASAGAVMESFHRLKMALDEGRITAVEYSVGLRGLTAELGVYVAKALDAAAEATAATKKAHEDALALQEEAWQEQHNQAGRVAEEIGRINDVMLDNAQANKDRMIALAQEQAQGEIAAKLAVAEWEEAYGRRQAEKERDARDRNRIVQLAERADPERFAAARELYRGFQDGDYRAAVELLKLIPLSVLNQFAGGQGGIAAAERQGVQLKMPDLAALPLGMGAGGQGNGGTTYNVNANYTNPQEPQSIRLDLESILMASAR